MTVRSARNNNPGNIESNSTAWVGKTGDDGRFVTYATPEHGVRAMGKTLETYQNKHGLTTVSQMISRWAPPNENNTTNYATFVASEMGISPDAQIDLSANPELAQKMVGAMIKMEGGTSAYDYFQPAIKGGLDMAYGNISTPGATDPELNDFMFLNEPVGEGIRKADPTVKDEMTKDILNTSQSLEEVVDRMEGFNIFWDNELDNFQNYTYNLELFQVNQAEARDYLRMETTPDMLLDVVNDAWPKPEHKKITIAKTGTSAELTITDLQIRGTGYGSVSLSRLAGSALNLQFTITQIGGTSLPDMLQNAALLSGYANVYDSLYFMKIKFMGYDEDNQIVRDFPATKVLPFKIKDFTDLDTTTDARGTTIMLTGTILNDEVVNTTDVAKVESNFEFPTKDTLEETLEEFMDKLNKNVIQNAVLDDNQFIHTYKISMSEEFKQKYGQADMKSANDPNYASANNETDKKSAIKISQATGVVQPGHSIYECLHNIILNAKQVRDELTASEKKMTEIFVIRPHAVPKEGGFNVLSGKSAYDVTFYVTLHQSLLPQNQIHNAMLSQATADILKNVFLKGRCHKRYYYQYTGKNDQIIDFQIQLRRQLEKIYSKPTDQYMANTFLDAIGDYRKSIDKKAQQKLTELEQEAITLKKTYDKANQNTESLTSEFDKMQDELASEFEKRLRANGVNPNQLGLGDQVRLREADINSIRESLKRGNGQTKEGTVAYDIFNDLFSGEKRENFNRLNNLVRDAMLSENTALSNLEDNYRENDDVMREALGHLLSKKYLESTVASGKAWDDLGITATNRPGQDIVLIEQLDKELIQKLSVDQFDSLMKTLIENPINFNRITKPILANPTRLKVIKHPDQEEIEVAISKYYEGRAGNLSMQNATMTIKGDPYWLETYIPVEIEKKNFPNSNSNEQFKMHSSTLSGANYCLVIADKAEGNYLENSDRVGQDAANYDGIKKTRLETMVYQVNDIVHSFSGGQFTQTLEMVKHPAASTFQQSSLTFGNVDNPTLWTEDRLVAHTDIPAELGLNDDVVAQEQQKEEADNISPPVGAGTENVDTNGDGIPDTPVVTDTTAAYPSASASYKNAIDVFIDNNGTDGIPNEADAKQLALVTSQLQDLCNLGNQSACNDLAMGRQQIANHFGEADEARNIINESIDDGNTVSPATIAMLDNTYESLGQEKISEGVVGVDQNEIDAWSDQIDEDMNRSYLGNNDAVINPKQIMTELEPGGLFGNDAAEALVNDDITLYEGSEPGATYRENHQHIITGGYTRTYDHELPAYTLTTQEANRVNSLHNENKDIINGRSLWDLSDEEYAKVKANEKAQNEIIDNATSGTRGEIVKAKKAERIAESIAKDEAELIETQENLDSWYWTKKGREEDEAKRAELQQSIADKRALLSDIEKDPVIGVVTTKDSDGNLVHTTIEKPVKATDPSVTNIPVKIGDKLTVDVVTANGVDDYMQNGDALLNEKQVAEYKGASSVYNQILEQVENKPRTTFTDEFGTEEILDYSNLDPVTYIDENGDTVTIQDPSTHFNLVDTSKPANDIQRYTVNSMVLKKRIANSDEFPNVATTSDALTSYNENDSGNVLRTRVGENEFVVIATERERTQEDGPQ